MSIALIRVLSAGFRTLSILPPCLFIYYEKLKNATGVDHGIYFSHAISPQSLRNFTSKERRNSC